MLSFKEGIAFIIGMFALGAGLLGIAGFFLGPLWGHPKAIKRAIICILISVVLFFVFWLLTK